VHDVVVEFVIQILKKAAKLASEAETRRREAWAGAQRGQLAFPRPRDAWGVGGGGAPPRPLVLAAGDIYLYCKSPAICNHPKNSEKLPAGARGFFPLHFGGVFHVKSVSTL
jgi:hypothetical protein